MFTGIIEETGTLLANAPGNLRIRAKKVLEGTKIGDSIAVNGVCLTVTHKGAEDFTADVMPQTLRMTDLGALKPGTPVNLERAMAADGRFGGHIVSGHIDGTGVIGEVKEEQNAVWVEVRAGKEILDGIVEKGSIAIDGVSLTVAKLEEEAFHVSLIPHTRKETNMETWKRGQTVNLENDILGKYVKRLMGKEEEEKKEKKITMDFLTEHGYF
ncbi:MAG: riboflavin synthase [Lachnospiraceae bacterium]|jgi:riboflavin synthase|nr:riboflavin synthase [Lachnospiraceae bacterium]